MTTCRELRTYRTTHRLLLTGTPLQNNLSELWSLLNFLLPEIFDDLSTFESAFDAALLQSSDNEERILEQERKSKVLAMLHNILSPFMLRRVKTDVDLEIPPKREVLLFAPMTLRQQELYKALANESIKRLSEGNKENTEVGKKQSYLPFQNNVLFSVL